MTDYCIYETATGRVRSVGRCSTDDLVEKQKDHPRFPTECDIVRITRPVVPMTWYIDEVGTPPVPTPTARPAATAVLRAQTIPADGVTAAVVSGLPNPATVTVMGPGFRNTETVTSGNFSFTTTTKGMFRIYVSAFPMQDIQFGVLAT